MRWWTAGLAACAFAIGTARADSLSTAGSPSPADLFTLTETWVSGLGPVTDFRFLPDGRVVIIEKAGGVSVRRTDGALVGAGTFEVDSDSEKGLLGLAVDPQFTINGKLYFYYSATAANEGTNDDRHRVVVRTLTGDRLDARETILLRGLRGPANHDGGALDVGPDGLLYVGVGDTGCNSGQPAEAQMPTNFYGTCLADDPQANGGGNGKILRIALDGSIPATNPLVGATNVSACGDACGVDLSPSRLGTPRADIFAWGFRNPFRLWVDPLTGLVWVGDVGEVSYEEIDVVRPGRHHGWPWREGARGFPIRKCGDVRVGTTPGGLAIPDGDCVDPTYWCKHDGAAAPVDGSCGSITGGQIVDTCTWPTPYRGRYVFGDYATNRLFTLTPTAARDGVTGAREPFATTTGGPVAIRTGTDGALYVAMVAEGRIARIAPRVDGPCVTTTTTTSTTSTTSTTVDPCPELTGAARVACRLDAAVQAPLCTDDGKLAARLRRGFARAAGRVRSITAKTGPSRVRRLRNRADAALRALDPVVRRAGRKGRVDETCRAALAATILELRDAVAMVGR